MISLKMDKNMIQVKIGLVILYWKGLVLSESDPLMLGPVHDDDLEKKNVPNSSRSLLKFQAIFTMYSFYSIMQ